MADVIVEDPHRERRSALAFMIALATHARCLVIADGYLLELLAWCAYAPRDGAVS